MCDVLTNLEQADTAFFVPLRMGEGFDQDKFHQLCQALRDVNDYYANSNVLPKQCVLQLLGMTSAIYGCMPLYNAFIGQQLLDASITLEELVIDGLSRGSSG